MILVIATSNVSAIHYIDNIKCLTKREKDFDKYFPLRYSKIVNFPHEVAVCFCPSKPTFFIALSFNILLA